jgi:hypothetical protein
MKKIVFLALVCLTVIGILPLAAQNNAASNGNDSDFYYVTVHLEKVYPYRKGYAVSYRQGVNKLATAYLPEEWFHGTAAKGDLVYLPSGQDWPHLTVYYSNGEFSHVRLYIRKDRGHTTWGNIPLNVNIDDRFDDSGDLKLAF